MRTASLAAASLRFGKAAKLSARPATRLWIQPNRIASVPVGLEGEDVIIGISGELDPVVVRPAGETDEESYVAVIMPMRI